MKISFRTQIATGVLLTVTGVLVGISTYIDTHRVLAVEGVIPVEMNQSLTTVEEDMVARAEAQEVATVIDRIDNVSLASYYEIQEARSLYDHASNDARMYIDEQQLVEAEQTYAELEQERELLFAEAQESGDLNGMLDYAPCNVQYSEDVYLNTLVQELIQKATTDDMSRSQQLRACYCYMVEHYDYAYNYNYSYGNAPKSVAWATALLRDGYGACNNWSSAFMYVARALGYDCDLCYGSTASSRGGSVEHYWTVISMGEGEYIFDPQVERDMTRRSGVVGYKRFGITGSVADAKYYFLKIVN